LLVIAVSIIFHLLSNCLPQFTCTIHYISSNIENHDWDYRIIKML
jgi:hypothetical protein